MSKYALLCVSDARSSTGYAWGFINSLYAAVARAADQRGMAALVSYQSVSTIPPALADTPARLVEMEVRIRSLREAVKVLWFLRRERVRTVYFSDRRSWNPAYSLMRLVGVRRIVVHDHTSGERDRLRGLRRAIKRLRVLIPGSLADATIAVSDFVASRTLEVEMIPASRVHRIWNSIEVQPCRRSAARKQLRSAFGLSPDQLVIACAARAFDYKGVDHLMRAFERIEGDPVLVYFGDGPALDGWRELRDSLPSRDRIILAGYREDARELMAGADVAVVPSVWAEAFGMAALEPMAAGVPVIASRSGGLPEVIGEDGCGILVLPGDEAALAAALRRLLDSPGERQQMGARGRERAEQLFNPRAAVAELERIVLG